MRSEVKKMVDTLGIVCIPEVTKCFSQVVHDEPIAIREELIPHLRDLPTREVIMDPVEERLVVANDLRHGREQVRRTYHDVDGLVRVAEHCDRALSLERL